MYKIAAFFEFNAKINKKILSEKNKVKKKIWQSNLSESSSAPNIIYIKYIKNFRIT